MACRVDGIDKRAIKHTRRKNGWRTHRTRSERFRLGQCQKKERRERGVVATFGKKQSTMRTCVHEGRSVPTEKKGNSKLKRGIGYVLNQCTNNKCSIPMTAKAGKRKRSKRSSVKGAGTGR